MKKVLIALDYNPFAETVAATGYALAKAMGAEVLLLHVVMEPAYYAATEYSPIMGFTGFADLEVLDPEKTFQKEAYKFLEQCRLHLGDDNIKVAVLEGDFATAIIDASVEFNADLVVMGTHQRKGFDKFIMGNLAETILNKITVPMLIVPGAGKEV
jgi:nucleotide-binding universal stress UspA family protein